MNKRFTILLAAIVVQLETRLQLLCVGFLHLSLSIPFGRRRRREDDDCNSSLCAIEKSALLLPFCPRGQLFFFSSLSLSLSTSIYDLRQVTARI
jgi:hypothetical protein